MQLNPERSVAPEGDESPAERAGALAVLTAAACALMGAAPAPATAIERAQQPELTLGASAYREDEFDGSAFGPRVDRYDIEIGHFELLAPLGERSEFGASASVEQMSGASPWFILPGGDGEPIQVMSGATIDDKRTDLALSYKLYGQNDAYSVRAGRSEEDDYASNSLVLEYTRELGQRYTLSVGYGYSDDTIEPTDAVLFSRVEREHSDAHQVYASLSIVLDAKTVASAGLWRKEEEGYLADPYKLVFVGGLLEHDTRPGQRNATVAEARLRRFLTGVNAALQFDYRYYDDSWGVRAQTFELGWHQNLPSAWSLKPLLRHYSQQEADFHAPFFLDTPFAEGTYSSDFRLSTYGALSYGVELGKRFDQWSLTLTGMRYDSDADSGLYSSGAANPGLVDFTLLTLSLGWRLD